MIVVREIILALIGFSATKMTVLKINSENRKRIFLMTNNSLLAHKDWGFPVPIFYGPGRIAEIGSICKNLEIL